MPVRRKGLDLSNQYHRSKLGEWQTWEVTFSEVG